MDIVKSLKDYVTDHQSEEIVKNLKHLIPADVCYVPIKNKEYIRKYFSPLNNFTVHTVSKACAEPGRMLNRNI